MALIGIRMNHSFKVIKAICSICVTMSVCVCVDAFVCSTGRGIIYGGALKTVKHLYLVFCISYLCSKATAELIQLDQLRKGKTKAEAEAEAETELHWPKERRTAR